MPSQSPVYVFDFRLSENDLNPGQVFNIFKGRIKKIVFQLEEGTRTSYRHYQGRVSLIKKKRKNELKKILEDNGCVVPEYLEPTTVADFKGEAFYQMKEDTKISGPWTEADFKEMYIPRQVREIKELYDYQKEIITTFNKWDTRTINWLYCPEGNIGKSTLVSYCRAYGLARSLPMVNDYKDLMRMVMDMPTSKAYLIDMPRAINKDRLFGLLSAIEEIKNGYAYDDRYSFKEKVFDCPCIWIFSNTLPNLDYMSADRWKIWKVDEEKSLVRYNPRCP